MITRGQSFTVEADRTQLPGAFELINEFALSGGKQFRPRLLLRVAECMGVDAAVAEPFAKAAERVHGATLLHDDVIDESTQRRGKPTLNAAGQNRRAILSGDLLLAQALKEVGRTGHLSAICSLFDVLVDLTEGELLQLEARNNTRVDERHLLEVARKKTGSLIGWCFGVPAQILGAESLTVVLRSVGVSIGIVFQMLDDVVDFDLLSGKPFAQDLQEGLLNFVMLEVLRIDPRLRSRVFDPVWVDQFKRQHPPALSEGIRRTLAKAEVELAVARASLQRATTGQPGLEPLQFDIIQSFSNRIKDCYRRYL